MKEERTSIHPDNIKRQAFAQGEQKNAAFFRPVIQPKLRVNQPNDIYEQEADAMADKVIHGSGNPHSFFQPPANSLQKKGGNITGHGMAAPAIVNDVINSPGQSLDAGVSHFMESGFGHDFSKVQIHNDSLAHQSSAQIDALAYTHENHIVFGAGQYQPATHSGQQLLAHELTHVIQQNKGAGNAQPSVMRAKKPDDKFDACGNPQTKLIEPSIDDARTAVHRASSAVGSAFGRPDKISPAHKQALTDNFHTTDHDDLRNILGKYSALGQALDSGIAIKCETTCPKSSRGNVAGYAYNTQLWGGTGPLHICFDQKGWDFSTASLADRYMLIIHEGAHRFTGVDDKAYHHEPGYKTQSSGDAMDNADSYAWFAASV